MLRRQFLGTAGAALGASALITQTTSAIASDGSQAAPLQAATPIKPGDWQTLRGLFPLTHDYIQLATFLLASHPKPVSDAIERHRTALDLNPAEYWHQHYQSIDGKVSASAAAYMGGEGRQIALTDSTTMGLAMTYSGIKLNAGDEILQTTHDHYSTDMSIAHRANRTGATVRRVALYDDPAQVSIADCTERLRKAIGPRTRVVGVTWVHSSTGVKLPIKALAKIVEEANARRNEAEQILFCVDGVHGFGIEDQDISKLGCDFFIAGTHKWIFGPRGTGIIWGSDRGWARTEAVIPSFSASYDVWLGTTKAEQVPVGEHMSPGGFHSFEHRWALPEAFKLHLDLGKANVQQRIHQLNTQTKEGLAGMSHVRLYTPKSTELSSGLVCFDVAGMSAVEVVTHMHGKGVIMSNTPYRESYARFAPSLINNEAEIDRTLAEIHALA